MAEGNQRFQKLTEILGSDNHKFPFEIKNWSGVRGVNEIRKRILKERAKGSTEIIDYFGKVFLNEEIQKLFNIGTPQITDYSDLLKLKRGKVYGLELGLMGPSGSHKDLMVASLISMGLMAGGFNRKNINRITDAGFFNSAFSTKYYANLFGLNGTYFVQETMPVNLMKKLKGNGFEVTKIPIPPVETGIDKKNATYKALLKKFHFDKNFRNQTYHLGHAELGFFATYPYGRRFVDLLKQKKINPDRFLSCIGAGTTLIGLGEPIQEEFNVKLGIIECEEYGPAKNKMPEKFKGVIHPKKIPSFDKQKSVDLIFSDYLKNKGYDSGVTSTIELVTAGYLAEKDNKVIITPIFETFRDYTKNARQIISREIQLNPFIPEDFLEKVEGIYHLEKQEK